MCEGVCVGRSGEKDVFVCGGRGGERRLLGACVGV